MFNNTIQIFGGTYIQEVNTNCWHKENYGTEASSNIKIIFKKALDDFVGTDIY